MDGGQEFKGKAKPGFAGKDSVGGIEGGGKSLADASEAVESNACRVGVGDVVVIKGVGDDEGGGPLIAGKKESKVVEQEEVGWEARVRKGEEVVERVGVAHGKGLKRRQCKKREE